MVASTEPGRSARAVPVALLSILAATASVPSASRADGGDAALESELRRKTQELMDAVAPGEVETWSRELHDNFLHVDENGAIQDKARLLDELDPLPAGLVGRIEVDRFRLVRTGDVAVAAVEIQEHLDYHGQILRTRFRFLDSWLRTAEGWKLLARHTAAVLKDPPALALPPETLLEYEGTYRLTPEISTVVRATARGLVSHRTGRADATFLPEVRDLFFVAGAPRSRRIFERDAEGRVVAFVDRREGEDIRWRRAADSTPRSESDDSRP